MNPYQLLATTPSLQGILISEIQIFMFLQNKAMMATLTAEKVNTYFIPAITRSIQCKKTNSNSM